MTSGTQSSDPLGTSDPTVSWLTDPTHRAVLMADAARQVAFFRNSLRPGGDIAMLDWAGTPIPGAPTELFCTTRFVHSYALARMAGLEDCDAMIDRCMDLLWTGHRDQAHGGYVWGLKDGAVSNGQKTAYGHVFVLLAAASARLVGHPDADRLLTDITEVLDRYFWDEAAGLYREEYPRDWSELSQYRGMNANMHSVEAMLAAFEATGETFWLERAGRVLDFFVGKMAPAHGWSIPEHYTADWQVDVDFVGDPMFRPEGSTPGHSFELARLLLQFWDLAGRADAGLPEKARKLIDQAHRDAWGPEGGYAYTLKLGGGVDIPDRYWWPLTEAIGAYAALIKFDQNPEDEARYRALWAFAMDHYVDHENGGWYPEIDADGKPTSTLFAGKPDIYHAIQACLFPIAPGLSRMYPRG